ncbi:MAG: 50S ribosomal protein L13 [Candidatus Marsarchaeota archaeon]|nr:50S ribosomal protein L13 [Candidatus Marsarchaeota archaeon]
MSETQTAQLTVIDGSNLVLGRLATEVAKRIKRGEKVVVLNAEKIVVSGTWGSIQREWEHKLQLRSIINPFRYSPKWYVRPDRYFRQVVSGMLPARKPSGREALSRLKVCIGAPLEYAAVQPTVLAGAVVRAKRYYPLERVARRFGWRGVLRNG